MLEEYGDKYINLREYMSTDAMKNADLTPTPVSYTHLDVYKRQFLHTAMPDSLRP